MVDLNSITKKTWRFRIALNYQSLTGKSFVDAEEDFLTLGGDATSKDSELSFFNGLVLPGSKQPFLKKEQYISVEGKNKNLHKNNSKIDGPTWLWGSIAQHFMMSVSLRNGNPFRKEYNPAIVNADYMSGIDKTLPEIKQILGSLVNPNSTWGPAKCAGWSPSLFVFNVIKANTACTQRWGTVFRDPWTVLTTDPECQELLFGGHGFKLVDRWEYLNHFSTMETFCLSY